MANDKRDSSYRSGAKVALKTAKYAAKGTKKLLKLLPKTAKLWLGVFIGVTVLISAITSSFSISQTDSVLSLTAQGEETINKPSEEQKEASLWDKEYAKEMTEKLLSIITDIEEEDAEEQKENIAKECKENGWDAELSLKNLSYSKKSDVTIEAKSSKTVLRSFSMSQISEEGKSTFLYSSKTASKNAGASQSMFSISTLGSDGIYRYAASDEMNDYLVLMPSYYGENGSRYLLTLEDGKEYTLLKVGSIKKSDTVRKEGYELKSGGVFRTVVNVPKLASKYKFKKNMSALFQSPIKELSLIESSFTGESVQASGTTERLLAAFSVYMDNGQRIKTDTGYKNQQGEDAVSEDAIPDYEKELKNALKTYLKRGHFYEIDYERDEDGNINIRKHSYKVKRKKTDPSTGQTITVTVTRTKKYVCPILVEIDLEACAEEIFDIEPNGFYINSGASEDSESKITNTEAINAILKATRESLFDISSQMSDAIYLSELSGTLEWPSPGIRTITSEYGRRKHPILKQWLTHNGVDIGTPMHSVVVAAEDGTVTRAGIYGGYGYYIEIDHGDSLVTCYGHLEGVGVSAGQNVVRGQQIAFSGNSGRSTGPHLHFEVKYNNTAVDPIPYVTRE